MEQEYVYELRIPKERVAVFIGRKGEMKRIVENETRTRIDVDSKEGEIKVTGKDALTLLVAREIIRAVGRGFNPEIAMQLLKQDYAFELISLSDYAHTKPALERVKGRVIGAKGKSRTIIENLTGCSLCVYGKTIGLIGELEAVQIAKRAVESLLGGSPHSHVYKFLEKKRREMHRMEQMDPADFLKDDVKDKVE